MTDSPSEERQRKRAMTDQQRRGRLTPEQYYATRQHGTERAGISPLPDEKRAGLFVCVCCGEPLFSSRAKCESFIGWPSCDRPTTASIASEHEDRSLLARRRQVRCAHCAGHLLHVFAGGPAQTTGLRYRINGAALTIKPGPPE